MRPRLLFVSPRALVPTDEGGKIRTANILRQMKGGAFRITLASPAPPDPARDLPATETLCDRFVSWPAVRPSPLRRGLALLDRLPVSVATDRSAAGRQAIAAALAEGADVVVIDFPHAAVLAAPPFGVPAVLFTHNVEAEILERHAQLARGLWRPVWRSQARKMEAFEGGVARSFDSVIAVSDRDARALARRFGLARVETIDTGVDLAFFGFRAPEDAPAVPPEGGRIVFTGVMDSPANIDGVQYFLTEIWPLIVAARPRAEAVIVGRNPPESLVSAARERHPGVRFTGFVDDIRPHVQGADVAVIPLRVGSGTRIKAFEAMAMGRPVVSTTIGVEGLAVTPEEHLLIADAPAPFAEAVLRVLGDAALRARLAATARQLLEQRFSWAHVARQFEAICLGVLAAPAAAAPVAGGV